MKRKKNIMGKKQLLLVTGFVALVIVMSTVFAVVISQKEVENVFTGANLSVEVVEYDVTDGVASFSLDGSDYTASKVVSVKNTSTGSAGAQEYVRVCIVPKLINDGFSGYDGVVQTTVLDYTDNDDNGDFPTSITGNSYTMSDVTFKLVDGWNENWTYSNGYFYYKKAVVVGAETEKLLSSVVVSKTVLDSYTDSELKLKVVVLADAIQTVGGAVESRWENSGLTSNDEARPESKSAITALNADYATSDSVVADEDEYISEYYMEQAKNMVSNVSITIYEPPDDNSDDESDSEDNAKNKVEYDAEYEDTTQTKRLIGDYEQAYKAERVVGELSYEDTDDTDDTVDDEVVDDETSDNE